MGLVNTSWVVKHIPLELKYQGFTFNVKHSPKGLPADF